LLEECALFLILEDKVHKIIIFVYFEKLKDSVAVRDQPVNSDFPHEALDPVFRVKKSLLIHNLDCYQVLREIGRFQDYSSRCIMSINLLFLSILLLKTAHSVPACLRYTIFLSEIDFAV